MPNSGTSPKDTTYRGVCSGPNEVSECTAPQRALVVHIVPSEDYGYCATEAGQLVYFDRNSVAAGRFGELRFGSKVELVKFPDHQPALPQPVQPIHNRLLH